MAGSEEFERMKREAMMSGNKQQDMPTFLIPNTLFAFLGGILAAYLIFRFVKGALNCVKVFMFGRGASGGVDFSKLGKWAVVTGATDGIGKAYAEELADEGLNIILVSRTQSKLDAVAAEIQKNSNVETKTIAADFNQTDIYEKIASELEGVDVGVLVNNVGVSYEYPEYYASVEPQLHCNMLNVNCLSVLQMMSTVLPGMLERKRGAIINVSSYSGTVPTALLASYSASKAFVDYLSRAVSTELLYSESNIIVQSVTPFFVATKLAKIRKSSFFIPEPSYFVRSALNTVGVWDHTHGCLAHEIQAAAVGLLPTFFTKLYAYKQLHAIRARFLKKNKKSN